jgi:hypothetical protein
MKKLQFYTPYMFRLWIPLFCMGIFAACQKESQVPPEIQSVRLLDPAGSQDPIDKATPGTNILIKGSGFQDLLKVKFNGQEASFNAALNTPNSIVIQIPAEAPTKAIDIQVPNLIEVQTRGGSSQYNFEILAPPPTITGMSYESPVPGQQVSILGVNFFLITEIRLPGDVVVNQFTVNANSTAVNFVMPTVTTSGPISITTEFGSNTSLFNIYSERDPGVGFLANFDNDSDHMGWAWWGGDLEQNAANYPNSTGDYIRLKPAEILPGAGDWWSGGRAVLVNAGNWVSDPSASVQDYAIRFDINTKVPWTAGTLQISANENYNITARFEPWASATNKTFDTENKWVTVTVPLSRFEANNGSAINNIAAITGASGEASIQLLLMNFGQTALVGVDMAIDNVRIVRLR